LNNAVAEILLEEKLGVKVELITANTTDQWARVSSGEIHTSLEVWPAGHPDEIQKYLYTDKTVENGGTLGPIAKAGWFIPTYLLTSNPELATWEGFKGTKAATMFAAATTGGKGKFTGGDPKWVTLDQQILTNLGIDFQVVFAGSEEAELAELDAAYQLKRPMVFYFWTPHWALAKYDLTAVKLPDYSDACWAKQATNGVDCDYPPDHLFKILWPGLKDLSPAAYSFLKSMSYTTKDQIDMMAAVKLNNSTVDIVARDWIAKNETVWRSWLPAGTK
jgi:glycine betaine/proline transport system substrate-binding protein